MEIYGFLSPEGEFKECAYGGHSELAEQLEQDIYNECHNNPEEFLSEHGWVTINQCFVGIDSFYGKEICKITDAQMKWILSHYDNFNHKQKRSFDVNLLLGE